MDLVMQVRAGGTSGRAHISDHLTLADALALAHPAGKRVQMGISGRVGAVVANLDVIAIAAILAGLDDAAVASGINRGAFRGREINA